MGLLLFLDLQQNLVKTAENVLKLILLLIKSGRAAAHLAQ